MRTSRDVLQEDSTVDRVLYACPTDICNRVLMTHSSKVKFHSVSSKEGVKKQRLQDAALLLFLALPFSHSTSIPKMD